MSQLTPAGRKTEDSSTFSRVAPMSPVKVNSLTRAHQHQQKSCNQINNSSIQEQYYQDLRINNCLREIFLNRFVNMFYAYEFFVIYPNQAKDEWLTNRQTLQNFDKLSFLSDQPEQHRAFLSRFLESQMFATLIDNKILSAWQKQPDNNLKIFDQRIQVLRKRLGENLMCGSSYEPCIISLESQQLCEKRLKFVDIEVSPPTEILSQRTSYFSDFPILETSVLNQECSSR